MKFKCLVGAQFFRWNFGTLPDTVWIWWYRERAGAGQGKRRISTSILVTSNQVHNFTILSYCIVQNRNFCPATAPLALSFLSTLSGLDQIILSTDRTHLPNPIARCDPKMGLQMLCFFEIANNLPSPSSSSNLASSAFRASSLFSVSVLYWCCKPPSSGSWMPFWLLSTILEFRLS